jgi:hypothetical protein
VLVVFATTAHPFIYGDPSLPEPRDLPGITLQADTRSNPVTGFAAGVGGTVDLNVPLFGTIPLGSGYAFYIYPSYFEFGGNISVHLGGGDEYASVNGYILGAVDLGTKLFDFGAGASVCGHLPLIGTFCPISVDAHVSSKGVGACDGNVGFEYVWGGDFTPFLLSCNFDKIHVAVYSGRIAQAGTVNLNLPAGLPAVNVYVNGVSDAPQVKITGPNGETASSQPNQFVRTGQFEILPMADRHQTLIAIRAPAAGRWSLASLPGSTPITSVSQAEGLPPASITASVSGRGVNRVLSYRIRPRKTQTVTFVEQAGRVFHVLGTPSETRGRLRFTPAIGPAGRREIVAQISLAGAPNQNLVVARYYAPSPPRASKPHVRFTRSGAVILVTWSAAANAHGYTASAVLTDGQVITFTLGAGQRRLRLVDAGLGGTLTVAGIGPDGREGQPALLHVSAIPRPGRVGQVETTTEPQGLQLHWGAAEHAVRYLFEYILSTQPGRVFSGVTTSTSVGVARVKGGTKLTFGVVGVAPGGRFGPARAVSFAVR